MKTKLAKVPVELEDLIDRQMNKIIDDCKILGINAKRIPRTKVMKALIKKINENEIETKKTFLGLL